MAHAENIKTLAANMAHAARNRETVSIGGGLFGPSDMKAAADILANHGEPLPNGVCFLININGYPVTLRQGKKRRFSVAYGADIRRGLNYAQAAENLGYCIMHALACESLIDNGE